MAIPHKHDRLRSQKHALVDRANAVMLSTIAITSVIVVFSFFIGKALIGQYAYQNKVIKEKKATLNQAKKNKANADQLVNSYKSFATDPINVLGGDPAGDGPRDGDNPRIVLDALPSQYDFPGLISSLEKLLISGGYTIDTLGGQEEAVATEGDPANPTPQTTEMPFSFVVTSTYGSVQQLTSTLEASIRPIHITHMTLQGTDAILKLTVDAKTFYQPLVTFSPVKEVLK